SRWVWPLVAAAAVAAVIAAIVFVPKLGDDQTGAGPASSNSSSPTASESSPASSPSVSSSSAPSASGPAHSNDVYDTGEFADGKPFIVVNAPLPGATVTGVANPVHLTGTAVVFEATVSWEVVQGSTVVDKGFTTASIGAPQRGDWAADASINHAGTY